MNRRSQLAKPITRVISSNEEPLARLLELSVRHEEQIGDLEAGQQKLSQKLDDVQDRLDEMLSILRVGSKHGTPTHSNVCSNNRSPTCSQREEVI